MKPITHADRASEKPISDDPSAKESSEGPLPGRHRRFLWAAVVERTDARRRVEEFPTANGADSA